eukprot:6580779-Alexandrium_andersonii.AAC.1
MVEGIEKPEAAAHAAAAEPAAPTAASSEAPGLTFGFQSARAVEKGSRPSPEADEAQGVAAGRRAGGAQPGSKTCIACSEARCGGM